VRVEDRQPYPARCWQRPRNPGRNPRRIRSGCGEAKAGQILVSQKVYGRIEERVDAEAVGELTLKGFHGATAAYGILGIKEEK
jgi:hypothetical protein